MAECLVWHDISMKQVYDFYDQTTSEDAIKIVASYFPKTETTSEKNYILYDLYYYIMAFAKENKFSPEKASAFFSIMKETHAHVTSSPFIRMEADYTYFKDLLLKHCINRPPFSEQVFSFAEMKLITEYATNTYFRHYLMYKYAFTKQVKMDFSISNAYITPSTSLEALSEGIESGTDKVVIPTGASPDDTPAQASASENVPVEPVPVNAPTLQEHIPHAEQEKQPHTEPLAEVQKEEITLEQSKHDIAASELRNFVMSTLAPKLDEMKATLLSKMNAQEESLGGKIKKLEAEEEKLLATLAAADKKKLDVKGGGGAAAAAKKK